MLPGTFAILSLLALGLNLWQWIAARRFALHRRAEPQRNPPAITLLKPLKGCDSETETCLRSWFEQDYTGDLQILLGVASGQDPVCPVARKLIDEHPERDARLVICSENRGPNPKISTLVQLTRLARGQLVAVSDADTWAPADLLQQAVLPLADGAIGMVQCFYCQPEARSLAERWEAVAVNSDFWSQVLQANSIRPVDFGLGAAMILRQDDLATVGGFERFADYLADDYLLGQSVARLGKRLAFCPVVVECRAAPSNWIQTWNHQLRWSRTIRVCRAVPYFFSILGNATLWPLLLVCAAPREPSAWILAGIACASRILTARGNFARLTRDSSLPIGMVLVKDLLQSAVWLLGFVGNRISWRGEEFRIGPNGRLIPWIRAPEEPPDRQPCPGL